MLMNFTKFSIEGGKWHTSDNYMFDQFKNKSCSYLCSSQQTIGKH